MARSSSFLIASIFWLSCLTIVSASRFGFITNLLVDDNSNYEQKSDNEKQKLNNNIIVPAKVVDSEKTQPDQEKDINYSTTLSSDSRDTDELVIPIGKIYNEPLSLNFKEGKEKYEVPGTIGVQGLIYCKSGLKYSPIPGAVARIRCVGMDDETQKTSKYSVLSEPCDTKGYFYAKISPETVMSRQWKIKECKAYLDHSPMESCKVPTNVNNGISGDSLAVSSNFDILSQHTTIKLSSVGPFFYASLDQVYENTPVPNIGVGYLSNLFWRWIDI